MSDDPLRCPCGGILRAVDTGGNRRDPGLACPVCQTWSEPDPEWPGEAPEHWRRWARILYGDRRPARDRRQDRP